MLVVLAGPPVLVREGLRQPLPLYFYRRVPGPWGGEGGPWGGRKERKREKRK